MDRLPAAYDVDLVVGNAQVCQVLSARWSDEYRRAGMRNNLRRSAEVVLVCMSDQDGIGARDIRALDSEWLRIRKA